VPPMKFDRSLETTLADCPCGWRVLRTSKADCERAALDHVLAVHPGDRALLDQVSRRVRREARDGG
jgi:hypothetical protein